MDDAPSRHSGISNEAIADILDHLGYRVKHDDLTSNGSEAAGAQDHGKWIDDRNGVKEGLDNDVPD